VASSSLVASPSSQTDPLCAIPEALLRLRQGRCRQVDDRDVPEAASEKVVDEGRGTATHVHDGGGEGELGLGDQLEGLLQRFGRLAGPMLGNDSPKVISPTRIASLLDHLEQAAGAQSWVLVQLLGDERQEGIDQGQPGRDRPRFGASLSEHALHGRVMDVQLLGDGADAPADAPRPDARPSSFGDALGALRTVRRDSGGSSFDVVVARAERVSARPCLR
jgi:hypothetical protein